MKVAIVAIAKDEDPYIEEWIEYNLKCGFSKIYIYLNDWDYKTDSYMVETIKINGPAQQMPAYRDFLMNYAKPYDWVAFFDIDEFIVLKKHNNINHFVEDMASKFDTKQIGINWVFYGDNGIEDFPEGTIGVLERFTKRQILGDKHIKSIIKIDDSLNPDNFFNPHHYHHTSTSPNGSVIEGPYSDDPDIEIAQINHYFCKTKPEYEKKMARGRADLPKTNPEYYRNWDLFNFTNKNENEDLSALTFYRKN